MSRVVYLHVGAPKTGTTYLQDRLVRNARSLAAHDVHMPSGSSLVPADRFQFRAALDLLGEDWGGPPGHAAGAWDRLVRRVRRTRGTVVISHEILAPAPADVIARALDDLADAELHVVYTARDLGRQVPAAWQESVKQGRRWRYRAFLRQLERERTWFHQAFDLPSVLTLWGADLPPERVHVVVVPPSEAPRGLLWERFCGATGIDPAWAPADSRRTNPSLGVAEAEMLRLLNRRLGRRTRREGSHDPLVRELLAHREFARRGSPPVRLPPDRFGWAEEVADRWVRWLADSGVHVIGDPAELRPEPPPADEPWVDPDAVRPKQVLWAAVDALAVMTGEEAQSTPHERQLPARLRAGLRRLRPL